MNWLTLPIKMALGITGIHLGQAHPPSPVQTIMYIVIEPLIGEPSRQAHPPAYIAIILEIYEDPISGGPQLVTETLLLS